VLVGLTEDESNFYTIFPEGGCRAVLRYGVNKIKTNILGFMANTKLRAFRHSKPR
jgi:hypothetical protein